MIGRIGILAVWLLAGGLVVGCTAKHLAFTTYTKVGLDISTADGAPTQAVFGYKRFEGAIIPVQVQAEDGSEPEVMSVYAALDLTNNWLEGLSILQVFATGQAAKNAAANPEAFADLVREAKEAQEAEEGGE